MRGKAQSYTYLMTNMKRLSRSKIFHYQALSVVLDQSFVGSQSLKLDIKFVHEAGAGR
jgi:hypothetical protein